MFTGCRRVATFLLLGCFGIPVAHAAGPATEPIAGTQAVVAPEAEPVLDSLRDAYAQLKSLELAGTLSFESNVMGKAESRAVAFTAAFAAANRFRHELKDQNLVACTGTKAYLFVPAAHKYVESDAPAERASLIAKLNEQVRDVLRQQNPSLTLALCDDAKRELLDGATRVAKLDDGALEGRSYANLEIERSDATVRLMIDPQTHLLRRATFDLADALRRRGVPDIAKALVTIDYTTVSPDAPVPDAHFAWAPPADAIAARADLAAADAGADADAPRPLEGKPAPDFTLNDLADKPVHLADLKGSVVVLDFWATWCGPCREGLPHLDKINSDFAARGVKAFAVNLKEPKDKAQAFLAEQNLSLAVLLDEQGAAAEKFGVAGIPHTVVIGKDGVIRRVFVGFNPETGEAELRKSIEAALRGQ
jgi:peroxiredoxin